MWNLCKIPFDVLWYHQICVKSLRDNHHVIYHHIFPNIYIFLFWRKLVVQRLSHVWLFATLWTAAHQVSLSITISWSLLKFMSIESVMPSNHLIFCCPFSSCLQSFPDLSQHQVFSNESVPCIRSPKYWSFSINPCNEYSVLTSFTVDWFDLLAVQGLPKVSNITVKKHHFFSTRLSYGPTLTSIYDYWKNHSFDYIRSMTAK